MQSLPTVNFSKSLFVCLFVAFLISACSSCLDRDIFKPKAVSDSPVKFSIEEFDLTVGAFFDLGEVASLRVSECGTEINMNPVEPKKVCLSVRVDEAHTFQFRDAKIEVYTDQLPTQALSISDLEYTIFTSFKSDGSNESDSSTSPPTKALIKQRIDRSVASQHAYYTFEPTALFNGASSAFSPPTIRAFSKDSQRRPYSAFVQLPSNLGTRFYVKLPTVSVDGKENRLPILEFNYSKESICYSSA